MPIAGNGYFSPCNEALKLPVYRHFPLKAIVIVIKGVNHKPESEDREGNSLCLFVV